MYALAQVLSTESADKVIRQQSGLYLKNILFAKDSKVSAKAKAATSNDVTDGHLPLRGSLVAVANDRSSQVLEQNRQRWRSMVPTEQAQIKQLLLTVLNSPEVAARQTAAQAIAEMGAIDLPSNAWPELLPALLQNVTGNTPDEYKVNTLQCLGYTCERLDYQDLEQSVTNNILTAIVDGLRADRPNNDVRHAAATALRNSLLFCRGNMENKSERDMIMQQICEATQCTEGKVRAVAYECIVQVRSGL